MISHERTGFRDQTYSKWHRYIFPGDARETYKMIDIDWMEVCVKCEKTLILIETAQDKGQTMKTSTYIKNLGIQANVPAYTVLYKIDKSARLDIVSFRVRQLYPVEGDLTRRSVDEYMNLIHYYRRNCPFCKSKNGSFRVPEIPY